jgi:FkbM family methyltransferase
MLKNSKRLSVLAENLFMVKHQAGWSRFLLFFLSKVSMKLFDRHLIPSYSQFGEDRLIECYFGEKTNGFYVDVGCNHPVAYSNTWKLYLKGWRGVAIDANPSLIKEYQKIRPNDKAFQGVISNGKGMIDFYFSKKSHLISGIGRETQGHWKRTDENSYVVQYETIPLYDILREFSVPPEFDLLSIDTEGNELDVLISLNLSEFKPRLIVVEIHDFNFSAPDSSKIHNLLSYHGYEMKGFFHPTAFFAFGRK